MNVQSQTTTASFEIGPQAIKNYSRMSYTMWYALAEFIDNSTQSRLNYGGIIDDVLENEGTPLVVEIDHDRVNKTLSIRDNSIGMTRKKLEEALIIARPTDDSVGRSQYGMGLKTAACWIGNVWQVVTCEWGSGEEWTATVDVERIASGDTNIPLSVRSVGTDEHYTKIVISDLHRRIQMRTEETIRAYIGSMYQFDLNSGSLILLYNDDPISAPDEYDFDTDADGNVMRRDLPAKTINGKKVEGWIGVLRRGGRKFGGFSLFRNERQIQGYPNAWKPTSIFGGIDGEGANNLVAQRLTGLVKLDGFEVSHTKDAILFRDDEEEQLEDFLKKETDDYRRYATKRRNHQKSPWSKDKLQDLVKDLENEFTSDEMQDVFDTSTLPPLEVIDGNVKSLSCSTTDEEEIAKFELKKGLKVIIFVREHSEYEPHVTIQAAADDGTIHVIINGLHPYFTEIESTDAVHECIRQYVYDAISEYRVQKLTSPVTPNSVRRLKNDLLRAESLRVDNVDQALQSQVIVETDL